MITIDPLAFYSARDVAQIVFGRGVQWFYLHRRALRAKENFPKPISSIGQPRWNGALLIAWAQRATPDAPCENVIDFSAQLDARARAIGAAGRRRG